MKAEDKMVNTKKVMLRDNAALRQRNVEKLHPLTASAH